LPPVTLNAIQGPCRQTDTVPGIMGPESSSGRRLFCVHCYCTPGRHPKLDLGSMHTNRYRAGNHGSWIKFRTTIVLCSLLLHTRSSPQTWFGVHAYKPIPCR